ncbi:MAG: amidase family protein [Bacteroidota bacterium]
MVLNTFEQAKQALQKNETSCEALVSSFLDQIEAQNEALNIFVSTDGDGALERARELDRQLAGGADLPLAGMVMGIKDVICIKGKPLTCASRILEGFESLFDATAIERLYDAGAIFVGKTNCDEFAMGSSNENSHFGPTRNPVNPAYVPGGSSGGSAAAVAAQMCHTALGSDTGGSVRQPAAFCGVVGVKPTYGRISRYGLVAYASSFDSIGVLGHTVSDAAQILGTIAGHDSRDATSVAVPVDDYASHLTGDVAGLTIGLPAEYYAAGLDPEIEALLQVQIKQLEKAGARVKDVSLPHTEYGIATYYILATAEASSNLARYDGVRYGHRTDMKAVRAELSEQKQQLERELQVARREGSAEAVAVVEEALGAQSSLLSEMYVRTRTEGFGTAVKRRIMLGTYVLSSGYYDAYYGKAQRVRQLIRQDFDRVFETVDVLLTPASPTPGFELGSQIEDPLAMYLGDVYTVTANLAGIPGLVVPAGNHSNGLPVGMQLLGRHFEEGTLMRVGDAAMKA